jgi:hypothetical protein
LIFSHPASERIQTGSEVDKERKLSAKPTPARATNGSCHSLIEKISTAGRVGNFTVKQLSIKREPEKLMQGSTTKTSPYIEKNFSSM